MSEHQRCVCCGTPLDNDGREVADGRTHTDGQCLDYVRAALGATKRALTTAERELAEARATIEASDTTRREWEVRAATSYAAGRAAGLREAAEVCYGLAAAVEEISWTYAAEECARRIRALTGPGEVRCCSCGDDFRPDTEGAPAECCGNCAAGEVADG